MFSTVVTSAFAASTASLGTYVLLGAEPVITLLGVGLGIEMAVKWLRRSASYSESPEDWRNDEDL